MQIAGKMLGTWQALSTCWSPGGVVQPLSLGCSTGEFVLSHPTPDLIKDIYFQGIGQD